MRQLLDPYGECTALGLYGRTPTGSGGCSTALVWVPETLHTSRHLLILVE